MMTEATIRTKVTNLFDNMNVNVVKNDTLYAPLTCQDVDDDDDSSDNMPTCGVGMNLALVHEPPLYIPSDHYTYITIIESFSSPNTPAAKAGLQAGDVIVAVNHERFDYGHRVYLPDDVADMIRGPVGSHVYVSVERMNRRLDFELVREPLAAGSPKCSPVLGSGKMPLTPELQRKRSSRMAMPVTPEGQRRLDSFEDRIK
mmetsp:Transcript_15996/g.28930  ORF Transcript_15996/g.28930 Transcript_15996/m.28930 type:complete len:201 (-) Transcript_15996:105-707(-)